MSGRNKLLTPRQVDLLREMQASTWYTPQHLGGTSHSHHSATLACLTRRGLVEKKKLCDHLPRRTPRQDLRAAGKPNPWPWCSCKGSCKYQITALGERAVRLLADGVVV